MLTFNLVRKQWIRCVLPDREVRELSLAETLGRAHEILEIDDESPLVAASLHRLLLAILHRVYGPRDTSAWGTLWRAGRFPEGPLEAYWRQWEDRFDLFDSERPFYQSAEITEKDEPKAVGILEFHRASGNNATLFDHTTDEERVALSAAQAARALVTHQTFALGGMVGYLKSCEKHGERIGFDGPSARGAVCLLMGGNLHQTLMLNLTQYDSERRAKDIPCWERETSQGRGERLPSGPADLFTWQSRRSKLFPRHTGNGAPVVDRVKLVPGFSASLLWIPFSDEPTQVFVLKRDAKPDERPWFQYRVTPGRAAWRDSSAILHGIEGERRRAETLNWVGRLMDDSELPEDFCCGLEVLGAATEQQKVLLCRRDRLPVSAAVLADDGCREALRTALNHAEQAGDALRHSGRRLAEEILSPQFLAGRSGKPDAKRAAQFVLSLGLDHRYWAVLEVPFIEFLTGLARSVMPGEYQARMDRQDESAKEWRCRVREFALAAFCEATDGGAQAGRGLRAQALAEAELRRRLRTLEKKLEGPDNGDTNAESSL